MKKRRDIELATPGTTDAEPQTTPVAGEQYHEVTPPPQDDSLVAEIILVLAAGYTAKKTLGLLLNILTPYGVTKEVLIGVLRVAARGSATVPNAPKGFGGDGGVTLRAARTQERAYRAAYILNAAMRVQKEVEHDKTIRTALADESLNYRRHESARKGRLSAVARVEQDAKKFGPLLGWYLNPLKNNEIECITANGHNFYADEGTVIGYPGAVHPFCGCKSGPPHEGAGLVNDAVAGILKHVPAKKTYKLRSSS